MPRPHQHHPGATGRLRRVDYHARRHLCAWLGAANTFLVSPGGPAVLADGVVDTSIGGFNISSPDSFPVMIQMAPTWMSDNNFEGTTSGIQFYDSKGWVSEISLWIWTRRIPLQ